MHRFGVLALLRARYGSRAKSGDVVGRSTSRLPDGSPSLRGGGRVPTRGALGFRQRLPTGRFIDLVDEGDIEPAAGRRKSDFGCVRRLGWGGEFGPLVPEC